MSPQSNSALTATSENDTTPPCETRTTKRRVRTETQLARKREIDRQSQYQIRHRNKKRMDMIEQRVADLQENFNKLSKAIEDIQSYMTSIHKSNRTKSPSVEVLYRELGGNLAAGTSLVPPMVQSQYSLESGSPLDHDSRLSLSYHAPCIFPTNNIYQCVPLSTPSPAGSPLPNILNPASPSITNTIEAAECFATCSFNVLSKAHLDLLGDSRSKQYIPRNPSLANLLSIDNDSNPVVKVISCSFRHCSPLKVPDTMATYFIMYRLLRWRVHPDPESYEDVPVWYRPSSIQESMPHNLSYDFWAWPKLRDALLLGNYNYCETKFNMDMCENITVEWPERQPLVLKSNSDSPILLNPGFEAHVMRYENWKVKKAWAGIYPELVEFVNIAEE